MKRWSKLFLFVVMAILLLGGIAFFTWQYYKYRIVKNTVKTTVSEQTDSLYSIKYDSLFFDEVSGNASLQGG